MDIGRNYYVFDPLCAYNPTPCLLIVQVDEIMQYVDSMLPKFVKDKSYQAFDVAKQAPDAARAVVADVQSQGVL